MSIKEYEQQLLKIKKLYKLDDIIGNKIDFNFPENTILYFLNKIEDRNIFSTRPIFEEVCYGWISFLNNSHCVLVDTGETEEYISNNNWQKEILDTFKLDKIESSFNTLEKEIINFYNKMNNFGNDYIIRADMAKKYVCNSMDVMRSIGNTYLHICYNRFFEPQEVNYYKKTPNIIEDNTYWIQQVESFWINDLNTTEIENEQKKNHSMLLKYNDFIKLCKIKIQNVFASGDPYQFNIFINGVDDLKDEYNNPIFTLNYIKKESDLYYNEIINIIDRKINLLKNCSNALEYFEKILKVISSVSIVFNVSKEANLLQAKLKDTYDDYSMEAQIATDMALNEKQTMKNIEIGKAIQNAIRKALNFFDFYNKFEKIITDILLEGVPQYDKIN